MYKKDDSEKYLYHLDKLSHNAYCKKCVDSLHDKTDIIDYNNWRNTNLYCKKCNKLIECCAS